MAKSPFYVESKPLSRADELRDQLTELEAKVGRLGYNLGQDALTIPALLDSITGILTTLQVQGHSLKAEEARLQTVSAQLTRKAAVFVREAGGARALEDARRTRQPAKENWWWFLDHVVAERRLSRLRRTALTIAGGVLVLLCLLALYQRFLAPDPATRERIRHEQAAESLLLEGDSAAALAEVAQALVVAPNDPSLLVLQGGLQQQMGQEAAAEESFAAAQKILGDRKMFLLTRGQAYLLLGESTMALADAQAVVEMDPESATGYMLLGGAYERMEDYQEAILAYQQASNLADAQGNYQLAATARVNMATLMQRPPMP
jgi:cytochrome c-type biogenesis protein CcmH/NrfG